MTGSGNANFFFAITLVLALAGAGSVLDAIWAKGRLIYEHERALIAPPSPLAARVGENNLPDDLLEQQPRWTRVVVQI